MLMPGHLLLYHPGVQKLKELIDSGELGEVLCVYGNRQNLGKIRKDENALWSLGVHDLSVILYLIDEEMDEAARTAATSSTKASRTSSSATCASRAGRSRTCTCPGSTRTRCGKHHGRRPREDGRLRRHGARAQDHGLREGAGEATDSYGEWRTRTGDTSIPKLPNDEPLKLECQEFVRLVQERATAPRCGGRPRGRARARAPDGVAALSAEIHPTAIVYPGTKLGEGVKVLEHAVVGKQPSLSPRSTAKREPLPPAVIGDGTIVSTGAVVFAGATIGARVILGDQSCVRERVAGRRRRRDRPRLARSRTTRRSARCTKIQAEAYITAYSTLEEHVFIAPCVVTTNDNFMGRTERRHELIKGPTIRRGARIGGGAILCPGHRDRRGGVRRRRRGRDEGRRAADARRRQPRARRCGPSPTTSCSRTSRRYGVFVRVSEYEPPPGAARDARRSTSRGPAR